MVIANVMTYPKKIIIQGGSNMTGTDFFFVTIIDKHLLAHAQCGLFTHKSVPVILNHLV